MKKKCLIVDDDLIARKSLERLCHKMPHLQVIGACADGHEALSMLENQQFDIVFLDLDLPGIDGKQLLKHLPPSQSQHVVLVTSKVERLNGAAARAAAVLTKPVSHEQFKKVIGQLL